MPRGKGKNKEVVSEAAVEETVEAQVEETVEAQVEETVEAQVEETVEAPAEETVEAPVEETVEDVVKPLEFWAVELPEIEFEHGKVVEILNDNRHISSAFHCKMNDGTTKHVPHKVFSDAGMDMSKLLKPQDQAEDTE